MNETKIEICRLCFTLLNEEPNFINKLQEQMLQIIVPDVKLGTSQFPLICKPCTKNLEEAFGFKSSFLELEDSIHGFVNEDQAQVDLEEVIGIKETSNISKNERICRTCFRLSENNSYEKLVLLITMSRYKRKTDRKLIFTEENLAEARRKISESVSQRRVASEMGIGESTLRKRLKSGNIPTSLGRYKTTFSKEQEQELAQQVKDLDERFYGLTKKGLQIAAYKFATLNNIPNSFNKDKRMAGETWIVGFCRRHNITLRQPEKYSMGICPYDPLQFDDVDFAPSLVTEITLPQSNEDMELENNFAGHVTPPPCSSKDVNTTVFNTPPPCSSKNVDIENLDIVCGDGILIPSTVTPNKSLDIFPVTAVKISDIIPLPLIQQEQNRRKSKSQKSEILSSTPFKTDLEATVKERKIKEDKKKKKENENQVTISSTNENYVFLISDDDEITTTSSNGILSKSRHIAVVPENNINTSKGKSKRRSHMVAAQKLKAGTDGIEELSDTDNIYSRKSESSDEDEGYTSIETKKRKTGGKKQQTPKQTTQLNLRKTVSVSEVINRSIHVFDDDFEYIRESISNRTITDMRKSSSIPENTARQPGLVTINFNNRKAQLDLIVEISDEDDTPATNKNKRHVPNILRSVKKTMEKSDVTSKTNSTCSAESESGSTDHSSAESDNSDSEFSRNNRQGQVYFLKCALTREAIVISDDEVVACACSHCVKEAILIKCALKKLHRCTYCLNERTNKKDNNGLDVEHQCSNVDTPPRRQFNKDDKLFNCLRCVFQAHNKSFISNHILDYHVQQKMSFFRCSSCFTDYKFEWQFERKRKLTSHVFRHLGGDYSVRYYCRLCFVQHEDETKLKDHLLEHKAPEEVVTYKCMKCLYQARSRAHVKEHIRKGHGQGKITCLAQVEKKTIEEDENIYVECPICKKYLNSKYAISHKQQHKFPCPCV
ncbi:hypothetical protein NQ318_023179 [Aromia moschata]|uniref:Uncharacterized protein n=1 Tax=Aromia moschata TaxID=1265417 RepID=A0AAV8XZ56_9CUCU|nr:hypothetical protein NQ318_023179 [Aromia moschata]